MCFIPPAAAKWMSGLCLCACYERNDRQCGCGGFDVMCVAFANGW